MDRRFTAGWAVCLIAVSVVAWVPSVFAADAPLRTGEFVAFCKTDSKGCVKKIQAVSQLMLAYPEMGGWCPEGDADDANLLTPDILDWLTDHPAINDALTEEGIMTAMRQIYPCR
jgi:hypothetical protein